MDVINNMLIDLMATMARLDQEKRVERIKQGLENKGPLILIGSPQAREGIPRSRPRLGKRLPSIQTCLPMISLR